MRPDHLHIAAAQDEATWYVVPARARHLGAMGPDGRRRTAGRRRSQARRQDRQSRAGAAIDIGGILDYLDQHPADLIVLLHRRPPRRAALAARLGRREAGAPCQGADAVRAGRGAWLRRSGARRGPFAAVLIPVDREPKPAAAIGVIMGFAHALGGIEVESHLLHVGRNPRKCSITPSRTTGAGRHPSRRGCRRHHRRGNRLAARPDRHADGGASRLPRRNPRQHTERVLRQAPCPTAGGCRCRLSSPVFKSARRLARALHGRAGRTPASRR